MRFLVDSDVFLHSLLHTDRGEEARDFLDKYINDIATTPLNLMEIGSVLSRKYKWPKKKIDECLEVIRKSISILVPTEYDIIDALEISLKRYLTPIDAVMLVMAKNKDLVLVTFDKELLSYENDGFAVKNPSNL